MNDTDRTNPHDLVGRAAEALRRTEVPPGPPERLVASTVEALKALELKALESRTTSHPPAVVRPNRRRETMFRFARYGSLTAAAGLLAGFLAVTLPAGREAAAFERVQATVSKAKSVRFVNIQRISVSGALPVTFSAKGDKLRMDFLGGATIVTDLSEGRGLQLDPQRKEAKTLKSSGAPVAGADIVEDLRRVKPGDVRPLGEQEIDGRKVEVFALPKLNVFGLDKAESVTLYADPTTSLPVRIEVVAQKAGEPVGPGGRPSNGMALTFEKFEWDAPLPDELFSLDVPAGYTVVEEKPGKP